MARSCTKHNVAIWAGLAQPTACSFGFPRSTDPLPAKAANPAAFVACGGMLRRLDAIRLTSLPACPARYAQTPPLNGSKPAFGGAVAGFSGFVAAVTAQPQYPATTWKNWQDMTVLSRRRTAQPEYPATQLRGAGKIFQFCGSDKQQNRNILPTRRASASKPPLAQLEKRSRGGAGNGFRRLRRRAKPIRFEDFMPPSSCRRNPLPAPPRRT